MKRFQIRQAAGGNSSLESKLETIQKQNSAPVSEQKTTSTSTRNLKSKIKSENKKVDVRCGSLVGIILHAMPYKAKSSSSSVAADTSSSQAGSMVVVGGAGANKGGGGGMKPSHNLIVAIVRLNEVDTGANGYVDPEGTFHPLFKRDPRGNLHFQYAMVGHDQTGTKAKLWEPYPLGDRVSFQLCDGNLCWVSVWNSGDWLVPGNLVKLNNVKLRAQLDTLPIRNPETGIVSDTPHPSVSAFYFSCDAAALDDNSNMITYPMHTKLRSLWPLNEQIFPTSADVAKTLFQKKVCSSAFYKQKVKQLLEECSGDIDMAMSQMFSRNDHYVAMSRTYMIVVDPNANNTVPCCDEYDPVYLKALVAASKGSSSSADTFTTAESNTVSTTVATANKDSDLMSKVGYVTSVQWATEAKNFMTEGNEQKESKFLWEIPFTLISWGNKTSYVDEDYENPVGDGNVPDFDTGIVYNEGTKTYRTYTFTRLMGCLKMFLNHVNLGPTDTTDIIELLLSHQIPFDAVLELEDRVTNSIQGHLNAMERSVRTGDLAFLEDCNEDFTAELEESRLKEHARWTEPLSQETVDEINLDPATSRFRLDEHGYVQYTVRTASWRVTEYLSSGTNAIRLSRDQVIELYGSLVQDAQSKDQSSISSIINPLAVPNKNGFIFLNDLKTNPQKLGDEYAFYALVCYGSNWGHTESLKRESKQELATMIELSNKKDLAPAEQASIITYLKKNRVRNFYYAVDSKVIQKCQLLAKQTYNKALARHSAIGHRTTGEDGSVSTTSTTPTSGNKRSAFQAFGAELDEDCGSDDNLAHEHMEGEEYEGGSIEDVGHTNVEHDEEEPQDESQFPQEEEEEEETAGTIEPEEFAVPVNSGNRSGGSKKASSKSVGHRHKKGKHSK